MYSIYKYIISIYIIFSGKCLLGDEGLQEKCKMADILQENCKKCYLYSGISFREYCHRERCHRARPRPPFYVPNKEVIRMRL